MSPATLRFDSILSDRFHANPSARYRGCDRSQKPPAEDAATDFPGPPTCCLDRLAPAALEVQLGHRFGDRGFDGGDFFVGNLVVEGVLGALQGGFDGGFAMSASPYCEVGEHGDADHPIRVPAEWQCPLLDAKGEGQA